MSRNIHIKNQKPFDVLVTSILVLLIIAYKPEILLFPVVLLYIISGPAVTFYRHYRKRKMAKQRNGVQGESNDPEILKNR